MSNTRLIRFRAFQISLVVIVAFGLCACSMEIKEPKAGSVVTIPTPTAPTKVSVTANASFTLTKFTIDGADVTSQMAYNSSSGNYEGNLSLTRNTHTAVATADVYCWYCTGQTWQTTDTKTFCVVVAGAAPAITMTMFEQGGSMQSWADDGALKLEPDSGANKTRWKFTRLGGIGSNIGTIESVQSPCKCIQSPDDQQNTSLALSLCDSNEWRQNWRGLRQGPVSNGKGFYDFSNRQNNNCITDRGGTIVQKDCNQTSDQLWSVHDNTANTFITDTVPW
jgi:hypothetical protein